MPNQFVYHNNRSQLEEHYRLRTQIYAIEQRWLRPTVGSMEIDLYDALSQHTTIFIGAHAVGCVRLVPCAENTAEVLGKMPEHYLTELRQRVPEGGALIISRLGITKELKEKELRQSVLREIFRQIVNLSSDATHWVAVLEQVLIRHLKSMGIIFNAVGEPITYHGKRQVVYAEIDMLLQQMSVLNPELHAFVTSRS